MCGRYGIEHTGQELANLFDLIRAAPSEPRAEIFPTNGVPVIRLDDAGRVLESGYRWWFTPYWWKKDLKDVPTSFNAKGETVAEKPMFRDAFKRRRCIIPASYFYEWTPIAGEKKKQRWRIERVDHAPLAFAGLWDTWRPPDGDPVRSCTIITTSANHLMSSIHSRMPVVLDRDDWQAWLDPTTPSPQLQALLRPCPDPWLEAYPG